MNGVSALRRELLRAPTALCHGGHSRNTAPWEPGHGLSLDTELAGAWILDFPASRT